MHGCSSASNFCSVWSVVVADAPCSTLLCVNTYLIVNVSELFIVCSMCVYAYVCVRMQVYMYVYCFR